jgi:hypothetical protein
MRSTTPLLSCRSMCLCALRKGLQRVSTSELPKQADHLRIGGEGGIRIQGADNRTTAFVKILMLACAV